MNSELISLCRAAWPELSEDQVTGVVRFHGLLARENEIQNLTRLISPVDFVEGHLLDVKELLASGLVEYPAADLGSGGGVPGLLAAVIQSDRWLLIESEKRKAQFLEASARDLGLSHVKVVAERAESALDATRLGSVVARAVGSVEKIYGWLRPCSTWNNLILLKGPKWDEEWAGFKGSKFRSELELVGSRPYLVGEEQKRRLIVKLRRVPRGTSKVRHR